MCNNREIDATAEQAKAAMILGKDVIRVDN